MALWTDSTTQQTRMIRLRSIIVDTKMRWATPYQGIREVSSRIWPMPPQCAFPTKAVEDPEQTREEVMSLKSHTKARVFRQRRHFRHL